MTISYDPANLPDGVDDSELRIHKLVDGTFVQMNAGSVDVVNHEVSGLVDGFSVHVLLEQLYPGSPEDAQPPTIESFLVLDESTGEFGSITTLELSSSDAVLTTRLHIRDDISGVETVELQALSPSGQQARWPCSVWGGTPNEGETHDTDGTWDCTNTWPRYSEAGLWRFSYIWIVDKVGNVLFLESTPWGLCDEWSAEANCFEGSPEIMVVSDPEDVTPPWVNTLLVSRDQQPRDFRSEITVDASTAAVPVVLGFDATDVPAGVGPGPHLAPRHRFGFFLRLQGPSSQQYQDQRLCTLASGDAEDGFWECQTWIPQNAEQGTWRVSLLMVPDRVGNGGRNWGPTGSLPFGASLERFEEDGSGNLCSPNGNCVVAPTVEVISLGDSEPPELRSVGLSVVDATVTVSMRIEDLPSGAKPMKPRFNSATTTQIQYCSDWAVLVDGTETDGTWQCSLTFPENAALGEWYMRVVLEDLAGNLRIYWRGDEDGQMCYWDPYPAKVCTDVGETDIFIE
jgi:hypothetical protein